MMTLYSYFRSSSSYRVRIALNIKGIDYKTVPINLLKGEDANDEYLRINPQGLLPALEIDNGVVLNQSLSIIEYLDSEYPEPRLLSSNKVTAAKQRAMATIIACEIHPLNNLKVLQYLRNELKVDSNAEQKWYQHWITESFNVLEKEIQGTNYFIGNEVSIADIFLVPQVFNAIRFNLNISDWPKIESIYKACIELPEFKDAAPENQIQ